MDTALTHPSNICEAVSSSWKVTGVSDPPTMAQELLRTLNQQRRHCLDAVILLHWLTLVQPYLRRALRRGPR
jgi:hypothetical protein